MKLPPVIPRPAIQQQNSDDPRITAEMREAARGLEAIFTSEMMKAMRGTVQKSEFSLRNPGSEIYEGMLDQEYAESSARQNAIGLSGQIIDYWLRSMPDPKYNENTGPDAGPVRTGGTHEDQSSE
ncbi:MAG: rod-binding protein [Bdellovibrionales bacterium]|nr:rod-binding protein [Bdellovibrionales bacterium]